MNLYGLIGKKLDHSFSAEYFNAKFSREGINALYRLFPIPDIDQLRELVASHPNLRGLNVTIPYKLDVMQYMDYINPEALRIGAVNTVQIVSEDPSYVSKLGIPGVSLNGFNTDCRGFRDALLQMMVRGEVYRKALILGTGGASRAVECALQSLDFDCTLVSRGLTSPRVLNTLPKDTITNHNYRPPRYITYDKLTPQIIQEYDVIVNCTPLGTYPNTNEAPDIPYEAIRSNTICFDLVYNPACTEFMKRCLQQTIHVCNGLEMLHGQAEAAWDIWNS